jgi:rubrerythrin
MSMIDQFQKLDDLILEHTEPPVTAKLRNQLALTREQVEAYQARSDKQEKTLATQAETITKMQQQLAEYDKWEQENTRYVLRQLDSGGFIYSLKPTQELDDPPHWLCTNCYAERHKSILQLSIPEKGEAYWVCPKCKNKVMARGAWPTTLGASPSLR